MGQSSTKTQTKPESDINEVTMSLKDPNEDPSNSDEMTEEGFKLEDHITWRKPHQLGLFYDKLLQSFTFKIVFTRAMLYPFFGVYLNMSGHQFSAVSAVFPMFWSLKFFWAFLSDSTPIFGKHRICYMAIGWFISIIGYGLAMLIPYPDSYYYSPSTSNGTSLMKGVQNEDAQSTGTIYVAFMSLAVLGVGITDLASDALTVDYVKKEPEEYRGRSNVLAQCSSIFGGVVILVGSGLALNSPPYGGQSDLSFTFQHILIIYFAVSILGFLNSSFLTFEIPQKRLRTGFKNILDDFWSFMQFKSFQKFGLMFIVVPALQSAKSPAIVKIKKNWALVTPLVSSLAAVVITVVVIISMYYLQKTLRKTSWKKLFFVSQFYVISIGFVVDSFTIFDVIRNQYFYFADEFLTMTAQALIAYVMFQIAAEVSEDGLEALTFGMLMTNWVIGNCIGTILGNIISGPFDVVEDRIYESDTTTDRLCVFGSVLSVAIVNLLSIPIFVKLCPRGREEIGIERDEMGKSKILARVYIVLFALFYTFIFVFNSLSMIPATSCLQIVGGTGC